MIETSRPGGARHLGTRSRRRRPPHTPKRSGTAFRLDLKALWEAIVAEGRTVGARARVDFLEQSTLMVWEAVEANTGEVVRGYRIAQESLNDIRSAAWNQLLLDGVRTCAPPSTSWPRQVMNFRMDCTPTSSDLFNG
ncbi:hypothetical protein [Mycobacterium sp. AT1]|uniref:hypothetical protein n=1 Tax=Mycobacterium sp. AT1 TaxID=1961706 RepID=UPI001151D2E6|nr:hypothetical protein [Mycobacterium sp. AT1]